MAILDPGKTIAQINRLLSAFPAVSSADAAETLRRYLEAIEDHSFGDLEAAVDRFIKAKVPGFDGRFAPTPPMLAAQCARSAREREEEWAAAEHKRRALAAPKQPEWVEPTPEQKERVKNLLLNLAKDLRADQTEQEAEDERKRLAQLRRTNARFTPNQSPDAMAHRLGFSTINTADDDRWDMGGAA